MLLLLMTLLLLCGGVTDDVLVGRGVTCDGATAGCCAATLELSRRLASALAAGLGGAGCFVDLVV